MYKRYPFHPEGYNMKRPFFGFPPPEAGILRWQDGFIYYKRRKKMQQHKMGVGVFYYIILKPVNENLKGVLVRDKR